MPDVAGGAGDPRDGGERGVGRVPGALSPGGVRPGPGPLGGRLQRPPGLLQLWRAQGEGNDAKYQELQFDELLDRAAQASDPSLRMDLLAQAEDLLIGRDHALAPLYYETLPYQKPDGLRGVLYSPLGYFFFTRAER